MSHIQYIDELTREYLLYRGFCNTLKAFDTELKADKDKGFRVRIIYTHNFWWGTLSLNLLLIHSFSILAQIVICKRIFVISKAHINIF
jgi:hypothetical protein